MIKKAFYKLLFYKKYSYDFNPKNIKKILILRYDRLGDMVVTLPLIETLKQSYPEYQIDVLASQINASIIKNNSNISSIFIYNFREKKNFINFIKVFFKLRKRKYDMVIDPFFNNLSRSSAHLNIINARFNIGLEKKERYGLQANDFKLFYKATPFNSQNTLMENLLNISSIFKIERKDFKREITFNVEDEEINTINLLKKFKSKKIILFNIQGSIKERSFNNDFIFHFSSIITQNSNNQIILISMPERYKALEAKLNTLNNHQIILAKTKTILEAVALVKHADIIISPDTSIVHIASCFNKKLITFYKNNLFNKNIFSPFSQEYQMFQYDNLYKLNKDEADTIMNTIKNKGYL